VKRPLQGKFKTKQAIYTRQNG